MKAKSLIVLLCLMAGIFSYVYFAIEKPAKEKELSGGKEDLLSKGNLSTLESFKISTKDKEIQLERQKVGWRIKSPVQDLASQSKVENLVSGLEKFKKSRVLLSADKIAKDKPDLAQYGLNPPKVKLEYKTSDLPTPTLIQIGEQNPSHTFSYALTPAEGVVLATQDLDFLSTQSADDFREMRLTTVASSDFEEVELTYAGKTSKFKKEGELWTMTTPYSLPIDQDFTRSLMDKISFVRANHFEEKAKNTSKPDIRILVGFKKDVKDLRTSEADPRPQGLELLLSKVKKPEEKNAKNKTESFEYFAKSDKTLESSIAQFHYDNFTRAPEDFIRKTFDMFLTSEVQKMKIVQKGKPPIELTRNDKTFIANVGGQPKEIDSAKIEKAIDKIRELKANKFLEISKQLKPTGILEISLDVKEKKPLTLSFQYEKDATFFWFNDGTQTLKYVLPKNTPPTNEFNIEAFAATTTKPVSSEKNDSAKNAVPDKKKQ